MSKDFAKGWFDRTMGRNRITRLGRLYKCLRERRLPTKLEKQYDAKCRELLRLAYIMIGVRGESERLMAHVLSYKCVEQVILIEIAMNAECAIRHGKEIQIYTISQEGIAMAKDLNLPLELFTGKKPFDSLIAEIMEYSIPKNRVLTNEQPRMMDCSLSSGDLCKNGTNDEKRQDLSQVYNKRILCDDELFHV